MAVSQNGWSANDRSVIQTYTVGNGIRVSLRKGDAGFLLQDFANWFDKNIRDIDPGQLDDWGYAERPIRGGEALSNHASGTAIDLNATKWPLGRDASIYLTADEIRRVRERLALYEGALRWGQEYTGRKDPMHFEINANAAKVAQVATKIRMMGDDDMPSAHEVAKAVWEYQIGLRNEDGALNGQAASAEGILSFADARVEVTVKKVVNAILDTTIDRADQGKGPTTLRAQLAWEDAHVDAIIAAVAANEKPKTV